MTGKGTPAVAAAERAGVVYALHEYAHDPTHESYAREAAECLGVDPAVVHKTLIARADDRLVVAVVPSDTTVDLKRLAVAVGAKRAVMAGADEAQRATGYVLGGISPLGQKKRLTTVLDASALALRAVFVSAGRRGLEIELAPVDLVQLTNAITASIARHD